MKASELFSRIEQEIPLELALKEDSVGYIGTIDPESFDVKKILILLDYVSQSVSETNYYSQFDLIILHHPPHSIPPVPVYVIHSNWDIIKGGASDALADCLQVIPDDVLDESTQIGRIGKFASGPVSLGRFIREIQIKLRVNDIRIVNCNKFKMITKIALVSGFGLNQDLIQKAIEKEVDVYISGDLTHPGAILAKTTGLTLIDATHYATEFPGLCKLGKLIASLGPDVKVRYDTPPWITTNNSRTI